ncbi:MAG: hypothetical protein PHE29_01395 [Tissierellia bacterium]|nr:hypothetical protein [Tissierellia bacterium]MDD4780648.1 hypothetical protein [Tissierellia bacterium]
MTIVIALTIHEFGHLIAAFLLKIKLQRFKITLFGFNLSADLENIKLYKKNILFFAGPFSNIIVFCILKYTKYYNFAQINLFLSLINMIPILPLDGGNICKTILDSIIDSISVCRYMIMTNCFFIVCFLVLFYFYKNWLYILLIIMAVRGIVNEDRHLLEKNIKLNYYKRIKRKK